MTSAELDMLSANYQSLEVKHMVVFVSFEAMVLIVAGWLVQEVDVSWCRSVTDDWVIALKKANKDLTTVSTYLASLFVLLVLFFSSFFFFLFFICACFQAI